MVWGLVYVLVFLKGSPGDFQVGIDLRTAALREELLHIPFQFGTVQVWHGSRGSVVRPSSDCVHSFKVHEPKKELVLDEGLGKTYTWSKTEN